MSVLVSQIHPSKPYPYSTPLPTTLWGDLQRWRKGLPGEDVGRPLQLPVVSLHESTYPPALFRISQSRQNLNEGLVSTQRTHPASFQDALICSLLSTWRPASHSVDHSLGPGQQHQKCWPASPQGRRPTPLWEGSQSKQLIPATPGLKKTPNQYPTMSCPRSSLVFFYFWKFY